MDLSIVLPCLNEEETLKFCIQEVTDSLENSEVDYEIVIADNGSIDSSKKIAQDLNVKIIDVYIKGYGSAIRSGILKSLGEYVIFADADGSYKLCDTLKLYNKAKITNSDMVIATRFNKDIEKGAMKFLHRYIGTPILTFLINILYNGNFSDCNSGFRCLKKKEFIKWNTTSRGMEFASELIIKAQKNKSTINEIPIGFRKDLRSKHSHMNTWQDGMRHLLFILSEKPQLFEYAGILILIASIFLQLLLYLIGPLKLFNLNIFDYHSQALLIPIGCFGTQLYLMSCYLFMSSNEKPTYLTKNILELKEVNLLLILIFLIFIKTFGLGIIFWEWSISNYANLNMIRIILLVIHYLCIIGFLTFGLLGIHLFKSKI